MLITTPFYTLPVKKVRIVVSLVGERATQRLYISKLTVVFDNRTNDELVLIDKQRVCLKEQAFELAKKILIRHYRKYTYDLQIALEDLEIQASKHIKERKEKDFYSLSAEIIQPCIRNVYSGIYLGKELTLSNSDIWCPVLQPKISYQ